MNNYRLLDFLLNILYDKIYNQNTEKCYIVPPIVRSEITIDKLKRTFGSNEEDIFKNNKIKFLGKYNNKWTYLCSTKASYPCLITFSEYPYVHANFDDLSSEIMINAAYHYMGSELVIQDKVKYILLPIMNFDIDSESIENLDLETQPVPREKGSMFSVGIYEAFYPISTLKEYLDKRKKDNNELSLKEWKVLLFQVLYTLYKLTERFKKFRHNMLNLDAIKVYEIEDGLEDNIIINNITYKLPAVGFEVRFTDFNQSNSSDYIKNRDTKLTYENPYYDVHYFLQSLLLYFGEKGIPNDLKKFFDEIIPHDLRTSTDAEFNGLDQAIYDAISTTIQTPLMILKKNTFFSEFIIERMDFSASPISNNSENVVSYASFDSPTDGSFDSPKLLARNTKNKNNMYSNNNMEIMKGSRRINNSPFLYGSGSLVDAAEKQHGKKKRRISRRLSHNSHDTDNVKVPELDNNDDIYDKDEVDVDDDVDTQKEIQRMQTLIKNKHNQKRSTLTEIDALSDTEIEDSEKPTSKFIKALRRPLTSETSETSDDDEVENIDIEDDDDEDDEDEDNEDKNRKKKRDDDDDYEEDDEDRDEEEELADEIEDGSQLKNKILEMLPEGYSGMLPDHMADMLYYQQQVQNTAPQTSGIGRALDGLSINSGSFGGPMGGMSHLGSAALMPGMQVPGMGEQPQMIDFSQMQKPRMQQMPTQQIQMGQLPQVPGVSQLPPPELPMPHQLQNILPSNMNNVIPQEAFKLSPQLIGNDIQSHLGAIRPSEMQLPQMPQMPKMQQIPTGLQSGPQMLPQMGGNMKSQKKFKFAKAETKKDDFFF